MSRFPLPINSKRPSSSALLAFQSPIDHVFRSLGPVFVALVFSFAFLSPSLAQREACTPWHTEDSGINNPIHYLSAIASDSDGRMIVAGRDGFLESSDGVHWVIQDPVTSEFLYAIATSGSSWVSVGENGTIFWSSDGETWQEPTSGTSATLYDVLWDGVKFIAVGYYLGPFSSTPEHIVMTSPTGENWTTVSQGSPYDFKSITWNENPENPVYVAGGFRAVFTSSDLVTWTKHSLAISPATYIEDLDFFDGNFFAVASGFSESRLLESSDGINWTILFTAPRELSSLIIKKTGVIRYVLLGGDSDGVSYESSDLSSWEETAHTERLNGGIWNEPLHAFIAVGQAASIISKHCVPCSFSLIMHPSSQAQGLGLTTFLAEGTCGAEPYTFEWRDESLAVQSTTNTLVVPPLSETSHFSVTAMDSEGSEEMGEVVVLVSQNPSLLDPNGDGENSLEDLSLVGSEWSTANNTFDADGDGRMTVLDLQYVSVGSGGQ